ncbi:hypothetical protein SCOCK_480035 [Actinacidiphila cocklensis]|uniref:Uncharacterized protein n=1 Tax=Actinacidiphila cocklensis TaxID=887465 RepID=A0A9W4GUH3_9ACTN|nr:hypothetical protein SCOCK_480035 [Actinacidiphila cocklensis]
MEPSTALPAGPLKSSVKVAVAAAGATAGSAAARAGDPACCSSPPTSRAAAASSGRGRIRLNRRVGGDADMPGSSVGAAETRTGAHGEVMLLTDGEPECTPGGSPVPGADFAHVLVQDVI